MHSDDLASNPPLQRLCTRFAAGGLPRRAFLRQATLLGLSAAVACRIAGVARAAGPAAPLPKGGTLRMQITVSDLSAPASFDWWNKSQIASGVCDWACRVGTDGLVEGGLLESWTPSPDLRSWTFKVRRGVTWRDGRPLVAADIAWNWRRWLDPAVGSSYLGAVSSYLAQQSNGHQAPWDANWLELPDDHTLRINLKQPQITVAQDLFSECTLILDPHENGRFGPGSNGTGPFELVSHQVGQLSVLKARAGSWRGTPHLDAMHYVDLGDDASAWTSALISDQVDGMFRLGFDQKMVLDQTPTATVYVAQSAQTCVARMRCDQKPFDDARVRRAMRLAIDPGRVLTLSQGGAGLVGEHHHVCPIQPDYAALPPMQQDVAQAKTLLTAAGHPNGFETTISCFDDSGPFIKAVTAMVEMWAGIGVRVNIQTMPLALYMERWEDFPFGYSLWEHRPLGVVTLALAYRTGMPWNESHYSSPAFDAALERALREVDDTRRRPLMAELEGILQQDGPIVQATWVPHLSCFASKVQGYHPHPMGFVAPEALAISA